jgi:aspartyl-tRNA(Asn)/glutamyl-tRNA(Gln) amidotransferase subunit A
MLRGFAKCRKNRPLLSFTPPNVLQAPKYLWKMKNKTQFDSIAFATIATSGKAIDEGAVTSLDLVKNCIRRINESNGTLNAFITILEQDALAAAAFADQEIKHSGRKGPLHGIPVAVKDFYDTRGIRTTAGAEQFKDRVPAKDAVIVEKLKEAGAILIGKTNMDRLGMSTSGLTSYFGPVRNPWNTEYITGGSSAGSAAAVAAGLCYATVDTDAIGSCRLPAACCGVTGLKVGPGLISQVGILAGEKADTLIEYFAQTGITTRSALDSRIMVNALAEKGRGSANDGRRRTDMGRLRQIGVVNNFKASAAVQEIFKKTVEDLKAAGYHMVDVAVPFEMVAFDLKNIEADRKKIGNILFEDVDLLILPTMVDKTLKIEQAGKLGDQAVDPYNTMFCNYFGLPAVSIPCGRDLDGMPLGLEIVSYAGGEARVLELAEAYEEATAWSRLGGAPGGDGQAPGSLSR